jgi:hypothetical protein
MSKVAITGNASGTGTFTIASPNSNTDRTLNLPDNSGTVLTNASTFAGTGPAFSANQNSATSCANGTLTKVLFQVEELDTNNNFASSTFTPTVAGYYQVNSSVYFPGLTTFYGFTTIYKNGAIYKYGNSIVGSAGGGISIASTLVYMNGTTDYLEVYAQQFTGVSQNTSATSTLTWFNGSMVRAA